MNDYDIVIKLDPAQPVASAQKVTGAVGDIEKQAESAQKALNDMAAGTKATADEVKKLRENTSGVKDGIGKMLQESAKGFGMQALHNGLMQVGSTLEDVTGGAFNFQHAMLGFAVAGPVGAAVGGFIGLLDNLGGDLLHTDDLLKQVEETGKRNAQMWTDMVHGVLNLNAAFAQQRKVLADVNFQLKTQNDLAASGKALGLFGRGQFATLGGRVAGVGEDTLYDSRGGLGAGVDKLTATGQPSLAQQAAASFQDTYETALNDIDELFTRWTERNRDAFAASFGALPTIAETKFGLGDTASALGLGMSGDESSGAITNATNGLDEMQQAVEENQRAMDALLQHMKPVEDFFVQLATTGKASFADLVNSIIADLARLGTEELLKDLIGAIKGGGSGGVAGAVTSLVSGGSHATGGSFTAPSTGGGVDSILMLSRVSPGERVDYTPRGQAYGGGQPVYASAPPVTVQVVDQRDSRALAPSRSDHQLFVELARQNAGFLRGLVR